MSPNRPNSKEGTAIPPRSKDTGLSGRRTVKLAPWQLAVAMAPTSHTRFVAECGVKNVHMALGDLHFPNLVCRILCKPESSRSLMDDAIGLSIWRRQRKLSNCPCACYTSDVVPIIFCEH